jgi:formate dehydrogenase major subunit
VPLRAGSDIAFLGAIVNHVLTESKDFRAYVLHYTNASFLLREDFRDTEDLDGIFSGMHDDQRCYDGSSWEYRLERRRAEAAGAGTAAAAGTPPAPPPATPPDASPPPSGGSSPP